MTAYRKAVTGALLSAVPVLLTGLVTNPAHAHGAPTDPVSRAAACAPRGTDGGRSAACRAASAARGGRSFEDWDSLSVADVRGRDREAIPDGKLCSGGIDAFAGLDAPREDWPTTRLGGGGEFTMTYRSTIPHRGTFTLYLTRAGYDPGRPLRWSDLDAGPFATAKDPAHANGAYRITGTLPADRTGRHVLFTIWRNTDTPDTYYSCSDVVLTAPAGSGTPPGANRGATHGTSRNGGANEDRGTAGTGGDAQDTVTGGRDSVSGPPFSDPGTVPDGAGVTAGMPDPVPVGSRADSGGDGTPTLTTAAAVLAVATGVTAATLRRRRS